MLERRGDDCGSWSMGVRLHCLSNDNSIVYISIINSKDSNSLITLILTQTNPSYYTFHYYYLVSSVLLLLYYPTLSLFLSTFFSSSATFALAAPRQSLFQILIQNRQYLPPQIESHQSLGAALPLPLTKKSRPMNPPL